VQLIVLLCHRGQSHQLFLVMSLGQNIPLCTCDKPSEQPDILLPFCRCASPSPVLCQRCFDCLPRRLVLFVDLNRAPIDDFDSPLQFASKCSLHLDIVFCPLLHIFSLVPFQKVICHRSPDRSAMPTIDAPITSFH